MALRTSESEWRGDLLSGEGTMTVGRGAYQGPYSFASRFEEGAGTNPEELIAAAHAGCFSMALAGALADAGYAPARIRTTAKVRIVKGADGFEITHVDLNTVGEVPGISEALFREKAEAAKKGCPVSKALAAVPVSLDARLA